jgi:hypothetical protein
MTPRSVESSEAATDHGSADVATPSVEGAIALADGIAAQGNVVDAINLLTDGNRLIRSPEIEARLVRLRHDAFASIDCSGGREQWPPDYADIFADVDGIPEVDAEHLSAEAVGAGILHHGSLIVRDLLGPEQVEQMVESMDRAFAMCSAGMDDGAPVSETTPWYVPFNPGLGYNLGWGRRFVLDGGGLWTVDTPRVMFDLLDLYHQAGIDTVLTEYLGERPAISVKKCTLRKVPVDSGSDWHQDGAFLGEGIRTVNVWLTLTDCGVDAPGLDVVAERLPGVLETGTEGAKFDWSVGPGVVERVASDSIVRPVFKAGDAILFDDFNLHRTAVEPGMVNDRYAIETWFFAPSTYPHSQIPVVF